MPRKRKPSRSRCRSPRRHSARRVPTPKSQQASAKKGIAKMRSLFTDRKVDELRAATGYNPRKRKATAFRLMLVVIEACLSGKTLGFTVIRAFFVKRFGPIRPRAFQLRFKQAEAAAFFKAALDFMVEVTAKILVTPLRGALAPFADVHVYDGTGQRVPPRGARDPRLKGCTKGMSGSKWVVGYSLKSGVAFHALGGAESASELKLWRRLVGQMQSGVLYLLDLGYFCKALFREAKRVNAHLLMRLKSKTKIRIRAGLINGKLETLPDWSLGYYLGTVPTRRGTMLDLDVCWGKGKTALSLRLVGISMGGRKGWRFYLTTVSRDVLSAEQIVQCYRLRWLVEFLFREWKQQADLGRSATADRDALDALTYGAMLSHALVRSLRVAAALQSQIPLEQLRPLACLHVVSAYASEIVDAMQRGPSSWNRVLSDVLRDLVIVARERRPSRSRPRIALELGAGGG